MALQIGDTAPDFEAETTEGVLGLREGLDGITVAFPTEGDTAKRADDADVGQRLFELGQRVDGHWY